MKKVILLVLLLSLFSVAAFAHSGGTDSSGGHYDHKNGGYHYHHGYSAHQHPGGVCPYSSSYGSSSSSNYVPLIYPDDGEGLLTTANVNMRSGAGTDYGIVTTLSSGTKLTYEGKTSGNWHYVRYGLNTYGWVHNSYLKIDSSRPAPTEAPSSPSTNIVDQVSQSYISERNNNKPNKFLWTFIVMIIPFVVYYLIKLGKMFIGLIEEMGFAFLIQLLIIIAFAYFMIYCLVSSVIDKWF